MKSKTKNHLSEAQIKELVKINFGDACEVTNIEELNGGMFHAVYLIERTSENDEIILKVGVAPDVPILTYEQDIMPTEVECFRLVSEQTAIPVPRVLAYNFSKKYINSNYFFMTAMEGITLNNISRKMDKQNLEKIKRKLAVYIAQMHQIKGSYFGYFSGNKSYQYSTWEEAFLHMFDQILKDGRELKAKLPYDRIEIVLKNNSKYLDLREPCLVNYDCHEGNIFVKKVGDEYQIEGIIDFERSFWGDPIADFAAAYFMIDDIRKEGVFLKGYLESSKEKKEYTDDDVMRYQLYRMYILTIMVVSVLFVMKLYTRNYRVSGQKVCL